MYNVANKEYRIVYIELSVMMEMFYICALQQGSH